MLKGINTHQAKPGLGIIKEKARRYRHSLFHYYPDYSILFPPVFIATLSRLLSAAHIIKPALRPLQSGVSILTRYEEPSRRYKRVACLMKAVERRQPAMDADWSDKVKTVAVRIISNVPACLRPLLLCD